MNQPITPLQSPTIFEGGLEVYAGKWGEEAAVKRARDAICSMIIGRGFGQSVEEYLASNPSVAARYNRCKTFLAGR